MNFPACIGKPLPPRCGLTPASSKSSNGSANTSENEVLLHKQKDPSRGQNLDYNSWMPDVQKTFLRDSHLQVCLPRHHDECGREARVTHWNVILQVLRRKFQNELEGDFTNEDWLHCFYRRSFTTRFEICKDEDGEMNKIRAIRRLSR